MILQSRFFSVAAAFGGILGLALSAVPAPAQQSPAQQSSDPYARYLTPGQCVQAGYRLKALYWRDKRQDTVSYGPKQDSLPASAIDGVRACMTRFTLNSVKEHELIDFARAQLMLNQDDHAEAAFQKLLASPSQQEPVQRGWTLLRIAQYLRGADPARVEAAAKYHAQLVAMGDAVATWKLLGHIGSSQFAMSYDDRETAQAEARLAVTASRAMSFAQRQDFLSSVLNAYASLAEPMSLIDNTPTRAVALYDSAQIELPPLMREGTRERQRLEAGIKNARAMYAFIGEQAKPIVADQWFSAIPGQGESGNVNNYPVPGEVTVLVFANANCGARCFPTYSSIRRLEQQFGERGVNIILSQAVYGWFRNKLTEHQDEAGLVSQYFQDFLELPVTMGIEYRVMEKRARDGRMMRPRTENVRNYARGQSAILIRKDGTIGAVSALQPNRDMVWTSLLERAVAE